MCIRSLWLRAVCALAAPVLCLSAFTAYADAESAEIAETVEVFDSAESVEVVGSLDAAAFGDGTESAESEEGAGSAEADDRSPVDIVFDFLTNDMGLNTAAACGVLANIERESAFRHDVYGDGGTSYGICQWHDFTDADGNVSGRFTELRRFCDENGFDWQTIRGQLEYLKYELTTFSWYKTTLEYLRGVPNTDLGAYDAADYWCQHFEIPADKERNGALRGALAREKYWLIYGDGAFTEDGAVEIWRVLYNNTVARAAPSSRSIVTGTLDAGAELRVTDVMINKDEVWLKVPFGWCLSSDFEYVSGALFSVTYRTECAVQMPSAPINLGAELVLPDAGGLTRRGFNFVGWEVDGAVMQPGDTVAVSGNITAVALWERDASVELIRGDANCDEKVNARDVTLIMRKLIGEDVWLLPVTADVVGDIKLNAKDVTALMKALTGSEVIDSPITAADESDWSEAQAQAEAASPQ